MNVKNLQEGQVIKNYKELCGILGIKVTDGYSKRKQLKELEMYCQYHKEGHKFIIDKIHNPPIIPVSELRKSKYIEPLSNIIIEYLYNSEELNQIPLFKLLNILGITNGNYESVNKYKKEFSQLKNIQLASIYYFYSNTRMEFKRIVESCLNNLQRRRILNWRKCVMIVEKDKIYKADIETEKMIITTEYQVLRELNKTNMYDLMKDRKALEEFNKLVSLETGGLIYYYSYELVIGDVALQCEYESIQEEKKKVNKLIIGKVNNTFDKDRFITFKDDYNISIDSLINIENENSILNELKCKRADNISRYNSYKNGIGSCIDEYINEGNIVNDVKF